MAQVQEPRRRRRRSGATVQKAEAETGPDIAKKLRADADDPDEVRKALDDAAGMSRNLWIVFLTFGTYLAIAVGSVTHRNLLLEDPIKLPLLNVELPLVAFFWVAPLLFLIFHAYLLLNLRLLVDNVRRYNEVVDAAQLDPKQDNSFRLLLTNFPFVQLLAGTSDSRNGLVGGVLRVIVWITVVLAPVVLLVLMQLQFLPYHDWRVTTVHRAVIVADLILLWLFWPTIMDNVRGTSLPNRIVYASGAVLTGLVIIFAVLIATFPGESHDQNVVAAAPILRYPDTETVTEETDSGPHEVEQTVWRGRSIYEVFFLGGVNEVSGKRSSLWSNTLVLPDEDFVEDETIEKVDRTLSLRGRNLQGAMLIRSDLRKADFTGANLNGAQLDQAKLEEAQFVCARQGEEESDDQCTSLQGASLRRARLQGAKFSRALMHGADLSGAQLQLALLNGARLQGADLDGARLQGAALSTARLEGASLTRAQLQGASLFSTDLGGANLSEAIVWGSKWRGVRTHLTDLRSVIISKSYANAPMIFFSMQNFVEKYVKELDQAGFDDMISLSTDGLREELKQRVRAKLTTLFSRKEEEEKEATLFWTARAKKSVDEISDETQVAAYLAELGCSDEGAPFVAQGLIRSGLLGKGETTLVSVAKKFLEDPKCVGAAKLSSEDREDLSWRFENAAADTEGK